MHQRGLLNISRILLYLGSIALVLVLFLPIWRIDLDAPQYPEGLKLQIFANDIKGDVEIINGLNHYIGMKTLHKEDFIEFTVLPYFIIAFALLFVLVALLNKKKWLYILFLLFLLFGIISMVDFWRWEYDYGHNLDPNAAIVVPGMAYQPPLIGFKQLLNFGAYSIPDTGGWLFIGAGVLILLAVILEYRKQKKAVKVKTAIVILFACFIFPSCQTSPQPLNAGIDQCEHCKMTISDLKFGAELINSKGKLFKFDDIICAVLYLKSGHIKTDTPVSYYVADYTSPHTLTKIEQVKLFRSKELRTPMNGQIAAFSNQKALDVFQEKYKGELIPWEELLK